MLLKDCVDNHNGFREVDGMTFEWDRAKHGMNFSTVEAAFNDPMRLIFPNPEHGGAEERFYAVGHDGRGVLTVRFTMRGGNVRVIGAGYWRRQKKIYEKENRIHE